MRRLDIPFLLHPLCTSCAQAHCSTSENKFCLLSYSVQMRAHGSHPLRTSNTRITPYNAFQRNRKEKNAKALCPSWSQIVFYLYTYFMRYTCRLAPWAEPCFHSYAAPLSRSISFYLSLSRHIPHVAVAEATTNEIRHLHGKWRTFICICCFGVADSESELRLLNTGRTENTHIPVNINNKNVFIAIEFTKPFSLQKAIEGVCGRERDAGIGQRTMECFTRFSCRFSTEYYAHYTRAHSNFVDCRRILFRGQGET